jgi:hypothetical protein
MIYKKYGENTGGIARSGYKLSLVLHDQGKITEAEEYKERAGQLRKKLLNIEPHDRDDEAGYDDLIMFVDH